MRLASFSRGGREGFGPVVESSVLDLSSSGRWRSLADAIASSPTAIMEAATDAPRLELDAVDLLPPIPRGRTICVGVNYRDRPGEYGMAERPAFPSLFQRGHRAQVGHGAALLLPPESELFDFEGEIAVIVGRGGRRIPRNEAHDAIAGITCFNDGSLRDWMKHGVYNVTAGKNFDASGAAGPWILTSDEVEDWEAIALTTRVNGAVVQSDTTASMFFPIADLVAYISSFTTLEPGDVIATGTPVGSGGKRVPPSWLRDGDVVEVEVGGVGVLRNQVRREVRG